ncbi:MAG: PTS system IIA component, Gat family [Atopobium sp.]|jgi:galactitol PTS system EIIA component|nr:PTS sugar transporter subunit IIA [Olsenella sp.]
MDVSVEPGAIQANLTATSQDELFSKMAQPLVLAGKVHDDFAQHVMNREKAFPTGLPFENFGVAIPHTDPEHVIKPAVAVATLAEPVEFRVMGDPDQTVSVTLVFMLALNDGHAHLEFLQKVIKLAQDADSVEKMFSARDDRSLFELVKRFLT